MFAAALIRAEPRIVALNFVQTEDNQIARRDYTKHMEIVKFLASDLPVALHAGEVWLRSGAPAIHLHLPHPAGRGDRR